MPFANLFKRFAVDAKRCRRARFQAFDADLDTAAAAVSIVAAIDQSDCVFNLLDQLALAIPVAQLDCDIGFLACAVIISTVLICTLRSEAA